MRSVVIEVMGEGIDLFRSRLDQIINMDHELVRLARNRYVEIHREDMRRGV